MGKYSTAFAVSWQNEFTYRLNFILWRVRNVLRLLMTYFLWNGVFSSNVIAFGYDKSQIITYIFMVLIVQSLILSAPSADNIGGEISSGDLSNYLVKPMSYLKYWFTRDLASKLLNIIFAVFEVTILAGILKPVLAFPASPLSILALIVMCILAMIIYYCLNVAVRCVAFWAPENTWGFAFIVIVFLEVLAGGIFPLDVLPNNILTALQFTPFPYLVYYPIAIFLGKISGPILIRIMIQSFAWTVIMMWITNKVWRRGLKVYGAEGK